MVTDNAPAPYQDALAQEFVRFAVESGVLRFGEFKTKAGRMSPYFFNAGLFDDGAKLGRLAQFYAQALLASGVEFDMVFGPAYKGIPLAATVAVELARQGKNPCTHSFPYLLHFLQFLSFQSKKDVRLERLLLLYAVCSLLSCRVWESLTCRKRRCSRLLIVFSAGNLLVNQRGRVWGGENRKRLISH